MRLEASLVSKGRATIRTIIGLLPTVNSQRRLMIGRLTNRLSTDVTFKRPLGGVSPLVHVHVFIQVPRLTERLQTNGASIRSASSVNSPVQLEVRCGTKGLFTFCASIRLFTSVKSHMDRKRRFVVECFFTVGTAVWFLTM